MERQIAAANAEPVSHDEFRVFQHYKLSQKCQEWWKRLSSGTNRTLKKSNGSFKG